MSTLRQQTPTVFSCRTDKIDSDRPITWAFYDSSNVIYNGFDTRPKYEVLMDLSRGEFNLTIMSLDASLAGRYICLESRNTERASAQLTIIGNYTPHLVSCTG